METRRLSTILFVDIAGYTDMMQSDEAKALAALQSFKKILEHVVGDYQGQIIQYFGDGCLLSFDSASQGVRCAMTLQKALQKEDIPVRCGMHLGEVVFSEGNAFGDGVNIASRIESMGVPEAVLLSKTVRNQIKNKAEFELIHLGAFEFKNVQEPMEVYAIANPGFTIPDREDLKGKFKDTLQTKQPKWVRPVAISALGVLAILLLINLIPGAKNKNDQAAGSIQQARIAVMPFQNLSTDDKDLSYSNGIMQNIIDNLTKIPDIIVLSSRSTRQYADTNLSPGELGKELGVQYLLDGTFQKIDSQIQVKVALTSTYDGRQIWTNEDATFSLPELFAMQAEIANQVANRLKANISDEMTQSLAAVPTTDDLAYDYYLRGKEKLRNINYSTNTNKANTILSNEAKLLFNLAIERDSNFATAYLGLARAEHPDNEGFDDFYIKGSDFLRYQQLINKALELDPELSEGYFLRSKYYLDALNSPLEAEINFRKALDKNPNYFDAQFGLAHLYLYEKLDIVMGVRLLKELENRTIDEEELYQIYLLLSQAYSKILDLDMEWYYLEKCMKLNDRAPDLGMPWFLLRSGQKQKALVELNRRFPKLDNQFKFVVRGLYKSANGQFQEAIEDYKQWEKLVDVESADNWFSITDWHRYGQALVKTGNDSLGIAFMRKQMAIFRHRIANNDPNYYDMAGIYAFLNQQDSAFYYLEKLQKHGGFLNSWGVPSFILMDHQYEPIRSEKRFVELFEKEKEKMQAIGKQVAKVDPDFKKKD